MGAPPIEVASGPALGKLHNVIADAFSLQYLLRFARNSFCAEHILCAQALCEFQRALDQDGEASAGCIALRVIRTHIEDGSELQCIEVPAALALELSLWSRGDCHEVPIAKLGQVYELVAKFVEADIFPRFMKSAYFEELLVLHPARLLLRPAFKKSFEAHIGSTQKQTLNLWLKMTDLSIKQSLIQQHAMKALEKHAVPSADALLNTNPFLLSTSVEPFQIHCREMTLQLEAQRQIFDSTAAAALNGLSEAFECWLDTGCGKQLLAKSLGIEQRLIKIEPRAVRSSSVTTIDQYADGW